MSCELSVVVPIYNGVAWLEDCLDSVLFGILFVPVLFSVFQRLGDRFGRRAEGETE